MRTPGKTRLNWPFVKGLLLLVALVACAETVASIWAPPALTRPAPYLNVKSELYLGTTREGLRRTPFGFTAVNKPAGRLRLLVLGSSAIIGNVCTIYQSIPGRLQELCLREGRAIEVINCGIPGADTAVQLATTPELLKLEPDIVVYYAGNNETIRLLSYQYLNPQWSIRRDRWRMRAHHSALYRLLNSKLQFEPVAAPPVYLDPGVLPQETTPEQDTILDDTLEQNVAAICNLYARAGAHVVLCPNIANVDAIKVKIHQFDEPLKRAARSSNATYLDLRQALHAQYGPRLGDNVLADSSHFLPRTNQYLAHLIYSKLSQQNWLATARPVTYVYDASPANLENFAYLVREQADVFPSGANVYGLERRLAPANGAAGQTQRGHLYFVSDNYPQAIAHYQQAVKMSPNDAILHRNLGHAYLQNDQQAQALSCYREFFRLGGSAPILAENVRSASRLP